MFILRKPLQRIIAPKNITREAVIAYRPRDSHNCEIHASRCGTKIRLWILLSSSVIVIRGSVRGIGMSANFTTAIPGGINLGLIEYCSGYLRWTAHLSEVWTVGFRIHLQTMNIEYKRKVTAQHLSLPKIIDTIMKTRCSLLSCGCPQS